ncbi:MAG: hypothetical protein ABH846_03960 [Patescibacteria group bacterium]
MTSKFDKWQQEERYLAVARDLGTIKQDIGTIREIAKNTGTASPAEYIEPGPYEVNIAVDLASADNSGVQDAITAFGNGMEEQTEALSVDLIELIEINTRSARAAEKTAATVDTYLPGIYEEASTQTRLAKMHLGLTAIGTMVQTAIFHADITRLSEDIDYAIQEQTLHIENAIYDATQTIVRAIEDGLEEQTRCITASLEDGFHSVVSALEYQQDQLIYLGEQARKGHALAEALAVQNQEHHNELIETLNRNAGSRFKLEAIERFRNAVVCLQADDMSACLKQLKMVFDADPTYAPAWLLFAQCAYMKGQISIAKEALRKVVKLTVVLKQDDLHERAVLELSRIERAVGNHQQADALLTDALRGKWQQKYLLVRIEQLEVRYRELVNKYGRVPRNVSLGMDYYKILCMRSFTEEMLRNTSTGLRELGWKQLWKELDQLNGILRKCRANIDKFDSKRRSLTYIQDLVELDRQICLFKFNRCIWIDRAVSSSPTAILQVVEYFSYINGVTRILSKAWDKERSELSKRFACLNRAIGRHMTDFEKHGAWLKAEAA